MIVLYLESFNPPIASVTEMVHLAEDLVKVV